MWSESKIEMERLVGGHIFVWHSMFLRLSYDLSLCVYQEFKPFIYQSALHALAVLLRSPCYSTGLDPPFAFRIDLFLHGIDPTRCLKNSSETLVHVGMTSSRSYCRFVSWTFMMWLFRSTPSTADLLGWDLVTGGHLRTSSCLRNQSVIIWALWHGVLFCWK